MQGERLAGAARFQNGKFSRKVKLLGVFLFRNTQSSILARCNQLAPSPTTNTMVLIHLKSALTTDNNDEFLFETKSSTLVEDLIASIVATHNTRLRANLIVDTVRGLSTYGLMKKPGSTETATAAAGNVVDPSGLRTGNPPDEQMTAILQEAANELEDYVQLEVDKKVALTRREIDEKISAVRNAVAAAYPMGLPEWEVTRMALEEPLEKLNLQGSVTDSNNASLWAMNKEFVRGELVSDRLGTKNEKTKVICKLTLKAAGAPPREAIVSEAERNAMAAFYFKRQEELKRLADADEDDYLNSEWADPKGMKLNLQGLKDVKAPGLRP